MRKKIFVNVFYNLGIIFSIFGMIWAYENKSPLIVAFFGATFIAFGYFKLQLLKEVKKSDTKP
jgi:hypothetical protein